MRLEKKYERMKRNIQNRAKWSESQKRDHLRPLEENKPLKMSAEFDVKQNERSSSRLRSKLSMSLEVPEEKS
jgi:hypothetical protein